MLVFPLLLSHFPIFSLLHHCQNVTLAYMCTQSHQGRNIQHAECRIHPALQQRHGCWDNLKLRSTRREKQQPTTPEKASFSEFYWKYWLLCGLKAWFCVLWWENYSELSHHLGYSCGLFRGMAQLLSIKLLYQTDLCTIRRVCSQDETEKNI